MWQLLQCARKFVREESGPTAVEYAVMLALILVVGVPASLAGSNREHGSLVNFIQGIYDTRPHNAPPAESNTPWTAPVQRDDGSMQADDFVIYTHMWQKNSAELGPLGRYQLELIA